MRARIAAAAARIMAEDGIDDFSKAKRRAARQLGAPEGEALPRNDEIEAELRAYRALYQAESHDRHVGELRRIALEVMFALEPFRPYLVGPVLTGLAGPYAVIDIQLFPPSAKDVELFLLDRQIPYRTSETRRYSGEHARPVGQLTLSWEGAEVRLSVLDPRDERVALKTSQAGKVLERANLAEVRALLA